MTTSNSSTAEHEDFNPTDAGSTPASASSLSSAENDWRNSHRVQFTPAYIIKKYAMANPRGDDFLWRNMKLSHKTIKDDEGNDMRAISGATMEYNANVVLDSSKHVWETWSFTAEEIASGEGGTKLMLVPADTGT
jgi:hypothetical protein